MGGDWKALEEEHTIKALALASRKFLELTLDPTPPPSTQLCHTQTLAHVREYVRTIHKLIPSTPIAPFNETMGILRLFHPLVEVDIPPFIDDFHLETEVTLNKEAFFLPWFVHHTYLLVVP
jgi:hypothetical protein